MTWHVDCFDPTAIAPLLATIRASAGTVVSCRRIEELIQVIWTVHG